MFSPSGNEHFEYLVVQFFGRSPGDLQDFRPSLPSTNILHIAGQMFRCDFSGLAGRWCLNNMPALGVGICARPWTRSVRQCDVKPSNILLDPTKPSISHWFWVNKKECHMIIASEGLFVVPRRGFSYARQLERSHWTVSDCLAYISWRRILIFCADLCSVPIDFFGQM